MSHTVKLSIEEYIRSKNYKELKSDFKNRIVHLNKEHGIKQNSIAQALGQKASWIKNAVYKEYFNFEIGHMTKLLELYGQHFDDILTSSTSNSAIPKDIQDRLDQIEAKMLQKQEESIRDKLELITQEFKIKLEREKNEKEALASENKRLLAILEKTLELTKEKTKKK